MRGCHCSDLAPYGVEENVWQGIEDLFLTSPSTRELVQSGKVKVVGAIYNVTTGKVNWLQEDKVSQILASVGTNPSRAMDAMANTGHGSSIDALAPSPCLR